jgi:hypothetical protein
MRHCRRQWCYDLQVADPAALEPGGHSDLRRDIGLSDVRERHRQTQSEVGAEGR